MKHQNGREHVVPTSMPQSHRDCTFFIMKDYILHFYYEQMVKVCFIGLILLKVLRGDGYVYTCI